MHITRYIPLFALCLAACSTTSPQPLAGPADPAALEGPPINADPVLNPTPTIPTKIPGPVDAHALYTCIMHPQILQDHAGTCPICGMTLILKTPSQGVPR